MGTTDVLSGKTLVIVEDDEIIAASLADYFGEANVTHTFDQAESLLENLPQLPEADVFIIDYRLPGMDGIRLFKQLQPKRPEAKYVCISGEMSVELAQEAQGLGFHALILKPFDTRILEQNIVDILS